MISVQRWAQNSIWTNQGLHTASLSGLSICLRFRNPDSRVEANAVQPFGLFCHDTADTLSQQSAESTRAGSATMPLIE